MRFLYAYSIFRWFSNLKKAHHSDQYSQFSKFVNSSDIAFLLKLKRGKGFPEIIDIPANSTFILKTEKGANLATYVVENVFVGSHENYELTIGL